MARLLVLGTGKMASLHAAAFMQEPGIDIVAAVEPNHERLNDFTNEFGVPHRFADLEAAIAWGEFDAAANVTPDAVHYATTMRLIQAGKHVLCEKPLATAYPLAAEMADAADAAGVINMVNLTYRSATALQEGRRLVLAGEIGEVRHFDASYYQSWLASYHWGDWRTEDRWLWRLSTEHGSKGVVGDVGIHIVDFAAYAAGSGIVSMTSRIKTFDKAPNGRIGPYTLDANDSFVISAELGNGAIGVIQATRWATGNRNELRLSLFGTQGAIRILTDEHTSSLEACTGGDVDTQTWKRLPCPPAPTVYTLFAEALGSGINGDPDFRCAADLQHVLDLCLETSGQGAVATV